jgi:hypothetical protein
MRIVRLLLALCCVATCQALYTQSSEPQSPPQSNPQLHQRVFPDFTGKILEPRCALITDLGPQFGPLVNACQYALEPEAMPNIVCQEKIERYTSGFALDTITAEVTIRDGHDAYTKAAVNGKPTDSGKPDWSGGWGSDALFSGVLRAVFYPANNSRFKLAKDSTTTETGFSHYEYYYSQNLSPGINIAGENPGMNGSVWVNRRTGQLSRVENIAVPPFPQKNLQSYHSVIDYAYMPVPELGLILFPSKAAVQVCVGGACYRNVATFHDCRKLGSEIKIMPTPAQ